MVDTGWVDPDPAHIEIVRFDPKQLFNTGTGYISNFVHILNNFLSDETMKNNFTLTSSTSAVAFASLARFWNSMQTFQREGNGSTSALKLLLNPSHVLFVR
ncbi:MAG: hypothetical protein FJ333_08875 [Sphingomonadales bacterium]|nr:hypothetical protein [Sphingomonadales bacterium]